MDPCRSSQFFGLRHQHQDSIKTASSALQNSNLKQGPNKVQKNCRARMHDAHFGTVFDAPSPCDALVSSSVCSLHASNIQRDEQEVATALCDRCLFSIYK